MSKLAIRLSEAILPCRVKNYLHYEVVERNGVWEIATHKPSALRWAVPTDWPYAN